MLKVEDCIVFLQENPYAGFADHLVICNRENKIG